MFSTLFTVALFFNFAIHAVFADFAVSNPEITACKGHETKVTWQAAKAPYNVVVVHSDDPCGEPILDAGDFQQTFANVKTDAFKEGQKVQVSIEDADGDEGWSGIITVKGCPASSASPPSAEEATGSTLVLSNTVGAGYSAPTPSGAVSPVGAANAANNFENAAAIPRHISGPLVALSTLVGAVALLL